MEVIRKSDVKKEICGILNKSYIANNVKVLNTQGTMKLDVANHIIDIKYSENGKILEYKVDGKCVNHATLRSLYCILHDFTCNEDSKIKLINANSDNWRKIHMDNKEICFRIATKLQSLGIPSHFKGYIYLFKCIYIVCETHIKGQLVDIEQIMKELALKYNISLSSLKYEINCVIELRMSHRNMQQLIELRSYYSRAGTGSVILNITHSLLDSLYWESQNKSDFYKLIICQ